jgi:hypothetical protein
MTNMEPYLVMINCISVMVRNLSYLIQLILLYILENDSLLYLISYIFFKLKNDSYLFNNFIMKMVFF